MRRITECFILKRLAAFAFIGCCMLALFAGGAFAASFSRVSLDPQVRSLIDFEKAISKYQDAFKAYQEAKQSADLSKRAELPKLLKAYREAYALALKMMRDDDLLHPKVPANPLTNYERAYEKHFGRRVALKKEDFLKVRNTIARGAKENKSSREILEEIAAEEPLSSIVEAAENTASLLATPAITEEAIETGSFEEGGDSANKQTQTEAGSFEEGGDSANKQTQTETGSFEEGGDSANKQTQTETGSFEEGGDSANKQTQTETGSFEEVGAAGKSKQNQSDGDGITPASSFNSEKDGLDSSSSGAGSGNIPSEPQASKLSINPPSNE